jgi:hypothetical protein
LIGGVPLHMAGIAVGNVNLYFARDGGTKF